MPTEGEVRSAFLRNWNYLINRFEEQDEASRHGESDPEFAAIFDQLAAETAKAEPGEVALALQAALSAAIETVFEFVETSPPPQTE